MLWPGVEKKQFRVKVKFPPRNHIFRWELEITTMSKNTRIKRKLRSFSSKLSLVLEICLATSHSASVYTQVSPGHRLRRMSRSLSNLLPRIREEGAFLKPSIQKWGHGTHVGTSQRYS